MLKPYRTIAILPAHRRRNRLQAHAFVILQQLGDQTCTESLTFHANSIPNGGLSKGPVARIRACRGHRQQASERQHSIWHLMTLCAHFRIQASTVSLYPMRFDGGGDVPPRVRNDGCAPACSLLA